VLQDTFSIQSVETGTRYEDHKIRKKEMRVELESRFAAEPSTVGVENRDRDFLIWLISFPMALAVPRQVTMISCT